MIAGMRFPKVPVALMVCSPLGDPSLSPPAHTPPRCHQHTSSHPHRRRTARPACGCSFLCGCSCDGCLEPGGVDLYTGGPAFIHALPEPCTLALGRASKGGPRSVDRPPARPALGPIAVAWQPVLARHDKAQLHGLALVRRWIRRSKLGDCGNRIVVGHQRPGQQYDGSRRADQPALSIRIKASVHRGRL